MKKLILFLAIILLFVFIGQVKAQNPCNVGCDTYMSGLTRIFNYENCSFNITYDIVICPGTPPTIVINITNVEIIDYLHHPECANVPLGWILPLATKEILENDQNVRLLIYQYMWQYPGIPLFAESHNSACWRFGGANPMGGADWIPCDVESCCIKPFAITVDEHTLKITARPGFNQYVIPCENPQVGCLVFCDENF